MNQQATTPTLSPLELEQRLREFMVERHGRMASGAYYLLTRDDRDEFYRRYGTASVPVMQDAAPDWLWSPPT